MMMPLKPEQLMDATPETKKYFKGRLRRAPVDYESFMTPLKGCTLETCQGMCCYDGVCVDEDEEHYLTAIINAHPVYFKDMGITVENAFEDAVFLDSETRKTRTKRFKYDPVVNFPKHFDKTSCIFRHADGRCALQSLAMEHGEHPWAYKPMSCWLHPISLERNDRSILWLPTLENDHLRDDEEGFPGYASFTHCGMACKGGEPAYKKLKMEIQVLGSIVGRDFYGEMVEYDKKRPKKQAKG